MSETLKIRDLRDHFEQGLELRKLTIPKNFGPLGGKVVWYYSKVDMATKRAVSRYWQIQADGSLVMDQEGIVEGLLLRLRDEQGSPLFSRVCRSNLMAADPAFLEWLWNEIGGVGTGTLIAAVEEEEKNFERTQSSAP